jgi:limonene-1,2-epoxide hydrolase
MLANVPASENRSGIEFTPLQVVTRYTAAKSRQDVAAALAVCTKTFVLDTVPFGIRGVGVDEVAAQLQIFFATFPDYRVTIEGEAAAEETVAAWGTLHATMRGALGSLAPTGRACTLPFVSVFEVGGARLTAERFFFDLGTMCEQLGLPADAVAAELRAFRARRHGDDLRTPSGADGAPGAEHDRGHDVAAAFVERFTRFWRPPVDLDEAVTLLHEDVRLIAPGMPPTVGREAGIAEFRQVLTRVPDFHVDLGRWSATADVVFLEVTLRGTVGGRSIAIPCVDRVLLRDGKVIERVAYFDPSPIAAMAGAQ